MPWCPVCKNEYKEGVTVCADCGTALVDSLEERKEVLLCKGEEALILRMQKFLEYNDIPVVFEQEEEEARLYVLPKQERKAKQAISVFLVESAAEAERRSAQEKDGRRVEESRFDEAVGLTEKEAEEQDTEEADSKISAAGGAEKMASVTAGAEESADQEEEAENPDGAEEENALLKPETEEETFADGEETVPSWDLWGGYKGNPREQSGGVYHKKSERADDLKSSGEVLLGFGVLGCIALLLIDFGVLPIRFGNRIMMNGILFALFFFFIGFGIYSLKGARKFRAEASDEDALTERIDAWVKANLTAKEIDEAAELEESDAEEICFFKSTEVI
ncbi:MAG: hypothetical protein NC254_09275, partial [bacterium]|nr:hypothetical protein [bacterium]